MTWILKQDDMYLSHLLSVDGHEPVAFDPSDSQRLAIRFPSRSAAVDVRQVVRDRQGIRLKLVKLVRPAHAEMAAAQRAIDANARAIDSILVTLNALVGIANLQMRKP